VVRIPKRESKKAAKGRDIVDDVIDLLYIGCHMSETAERLTHIGTGEINKKHMQANITGYKLVGALRKVKNELDGKGERSYIKKKD